MDCGGYELKREARDSLRGTCHWHLGRANLAYEYWPEAGVARVVRFADAGDEVLEDVPVSSPEEAGTVFARHAGAGW